MAELFKDPPMAAFRRPRNLKDMVVRAKLDNPLPNGGFKTCSDTRCLMCKHSTDTDKFTSPVTGRTYKILGNMSCRTDNCVYLISCKACSKQYVGETGDLRWRMNNHRSTIKTKKKKRKSPSGNISTLTVTNGRIWQWWSLTIILTGQMRREKVRKSSGCTGSNHLDLMAWTNW